MGQLFLMSEKHIVPGDHYHKFIIFYLSDSLFH